MENLTLDYEKTEGTKGTGGTGSNGAAYSGSPTKKAEGTGGTGTLPDDYGIEKVKARNEKIRRSKTRAIDAAINPLHDADEHIERLSFDDLELPCFIIKDDWFYLDGKRKPEVDPIDWTAIYRS
jgi:putative DNA primase/helicase